MNTLVQDQSAAEGPGFAGPDSGRLPRRPRRRYLTKSSLVLTAAVTSAVGFYAGVRVEKGQVSSSGAGSTPGGSFSALAARLRSGGATGAVAGTGATGAGGAGRGASAGGPPAGLLGGGAASGGAGASAGTVASVSGSTLYVTDASGNTIKVRLSSSTNVTKSLGVGRSALRPGDTVVVRGVKNARGTLVAASLSDSGKASGSRTGSTTGSGGSGLSSLFSSGG
jgi:hypothetical protein